MVKVVYNVVGYLVGIIFGVLVVFPIIIMSILIRATEMIRCYRTRASLAEKALSYLRWLGLAYEKVLDVNFMEIGGGIPATYRYILEEIVYS